MSVNASSCFSDAPGKQGGGVVTGCVNPRTGRTVLFRVGALAALLIAGAAADAPAQTVVSWRNSDLDNSDSVINAYVGEGNIRRGSNVSRVSDTNRYTTTGWPNTERSAPNFNNQYIEIRFATQGYTGLYVEFSHSRTSGGPDYAKVYAETSPGTFTQLGNRFSLGTSDTNVSLLLPSQLEGKTMASPARLRIHVYGSGGTGRNYRLRDLAIRVGNKAPVLTLPSGPFTVAEDTSLPIPGITVADPDAGNADLRLQISVANGNGTITFGSTSGLQFVSGSNGSSSLNVQGTLSELNAALQTLSFKGASNFVGTATVNLTLDDRGNTGPGGSKTDSKSLSISVTPVNDPPVINTPSGTLTNVNEDSDYELPSSLSFSDPDAGNNQVELSIAVTNGTLRFNSTSGVTFVSGSNNSSNMVVRATISTLNNRDLIFRGLQNYNGPAQISLVLNDLGNTGGGPLSASATIPINIRAVNDAPVVTLPSGPYDAIKDTPLVITGCSVTDVDAGTGSIRVRFQVSRGQISVPTPLPAGVTVQSGTNGSSDFTLQGTLAALNTAISSFTYYPRPGQTDNVTLTVSCDDRGNTGNGGAKTGSKSVSFTVREPNDPPVLSAPATVSGNEDSNITIGGVSIADPDAGNNSMEVTLNATNGVVRLATTYQLTFVSGSNNSSSMVFRGSRTRLNNALNNFVYEPDDDFNGTATITLLVDDRGNTGGGGPKTDEKTISVAVSPVNDAPSLTVPASQTVNEDEPLTLSQISVADPDADEIPDGGLELTLSATSGTLTFGDLTGLTVTAGENSSSTLAVRGSVAALNAALSSLTYQGFQDYNGVDMIAVSVSDLGNTGAGGPLSASDTIPVTVLPVNDRAVITMPSSLTIRKDTDLPLTGIQVYDPDAEDEILVTVSVQNGTLRLSATDEVTVSSSGTGTEYGPAPSLTIQGSVDAVNAALQTLIYRSNEGYFGPETITVVVDDMGAGGEVGQQIASESVPLTVEVPVTVSGFALE